MIIHACERQVNNLAVLYSHLGDYKTAEPLFKQALAIRKEAWGRITPTMLPV